MDWVYLTQARRYGKINGPCVHIRPVSRPLPLIAGLLGVLFLAIAAMYWFVPAGVEEGVPYFHFKRAIASLIIALVLFAFAWLQSRRRPPDVRT